MVRKIFSFIVLFFVVLVAQANKVVYALQEGEYHYSGDIVSVKDADGKEVASLIFGESGGEDFEGAFQYYIEVEGYTAYTKGNGVNGDKVGGTFYTIIPKGDGVIDVAIVLNPNKKFFIEENGTPLADYNGIVMDEKYVGTFSFPVEAGRNYKIYAAGSKLGFFGFAYTYGDNTPALRCDKPIISFSNGTISIASSTKGSTIHYTLDGTTPTTNSNVYSTPITLTQNCTVKAIAVAEGYLDSEVASYTVDWFGTDVTKIPLSDVTMYNWDGYGADAKIVSPFAGVYELNTSTGLVYGDTSIKAFADLSPYSRLDITYTEGFPRVLINRDVDEGQWNAIESQSHLIDNTKEGWSAKYFKNNGNVLSVELQQILKDKGFVHLHAIKGANWTNVTVTNMELVVENITTTPQTGTPQISRQDNILTISTSTEGATIYYTLDGSTPTTSSNIYTNPITLTQNCTVKAIAVAEGHENSDVATYSVNWFKVEDVTISFINLKVELSTSTANARIYYTTDDSTPTENSIRYTEPFAVSANCTVKAIAYKDNFNVSDVTSLYIDLSNVKCDTPTFQMSGGVLTISTVTEGTTIYYTLDGTTPTTSSERYAGPVTLAKNGTAKAIATKEGYLDSEVGSYEVTYFQVEMPSFAVEDNILTIACGTQGASVYYVIGDGTVDITEQNKYTGPITLYDNRAVRAVGVLDGYRNSEEAIYRHNSITCGDVAINFDGHYMRMSSTTEGATIYYTTDGSNPTAASSYYREPVAIDELCTINAVAAKENMNSSKVAKMELSYVYDGTTVSVKKAGLLSKAFEWYQGTTTSNRLVVKGQLNTEDMVFMKTLSAVEHLDMKNVTFANQDLPDLAFANMNLVSIELPAGITQVGKGLFDGCSRLAAIIWNANKELTSEAMEGINNPNLLIYANALTLVPSSTNVISMVNDKAQNIVLQDAENGNFYCPRKFTAQQISYTRNFMLKSGRQKCGGWETIALPFSVATITHEQNGLLAPFGSSTANAKPFWLYSLQSTGFNPAMEIVANTPYIICMPNHEDYADEYNQGGHVTFAATNVEVPVTTTVVTSQVNSGSTVSLIPAFSRIDKSDSIYAINRESYGTFAPGSLFIKDSRDIYPFEAYSTVSIKDAGSEAPLFIPVMDNMTTTIIEKLLTKGANSTLKVYNLNGLLVKTVTSEEELKQLPKGVYIVNGRKVVMK